MATDNVSLNLEGLLGDASTLITEADLEGGEDDVNQVVDERFGELDDTLHFVGFQFGSEEYGIEIKLIQEIIMVGNITIVPGVSSYYEGVINLRGNIVPVINLREKLNMPPHPIDIDSRIIIMDIEEMTVGFLVDRITQVIRLPEHNIEQPTASFGGIAVEFLNGLGRMGEDEGIVGLLNVGRIIEHEVELLNLQGDEV